MYVWIWRKLPGGLPGKLAGTTLLLAAALALLFFVVFPWVEPRLPFNEVTVNQHGASHSSGATSHSGGGTPSTTATPSR